MDGECSETEPLYCYGGELINYCSYCGCPSGIICDNDGDGFNNANICDSFLEELDCDDNNESIFPDAPEVCDGIDNNCDDEVDMIDNTPLIIDLNPNDNLIEICENGIWTVHEGQEYCEYIGGTMCSETETICYGSYPQTGDWLFSSCCDGLCLLEEIPPNFDWRNVNEQNWMTSVKNQGSCGSCWAFATLGLVESQNNILNNNAFLDIDLSEQELVSCAPNGDCGGASQSVGISYVNNTGIIFEESFPYVAANVPCSYPINSERYTINNYGKINSESYLKNALNTYGPLEVSMTWSGMQFDNQGIGRCDEYFNNGHAIVLVGYQDDSTLPEGGYWIIKNSWGPSWNENGYGKIAYGNCHFGLGSSYFVS